ncbi:MFS transporter [Acetobacteraceae bacterium KSS8]|uniref:MFS transporter n=1 Tax=Endosaccharibacter trunci TaxID=2812733 RepID=A0ABT1W7P4_9PROT|nr:MFS transporter [Acetobacteraceae bacterium KSS8]
MAVKLRPLLGLFGVITAAISAEFNDQVASIAGGDISGGLGLSHDPSTWFDSLYVSAEVFGMAVSPFLLVTFSLRQFSLFVVLLNVCSSAVIPYAPDAVALYLLRIMQGLSGGFTIPLLMTTALRVLEPSIRLYGLAVYALTATFTPALATSMAGLWTDLVGWQFVFLEAVPLCTLAGLLIWFGLPQDPGRYERFRKFNWRGALLILIGLGSFSTMLQQGDRLDWFNSDLICVLAAISAIAIPLLIVNEWFAEIPFLKLQMLGSRNFAYGAAALLLFVIVSPSASSVPNNFLREVQDMRPEQFYTVSLLIAGIQLVMLPLMAFLLDFPQIDARIWSVIGLLLVGGGCVGASFCTIAWFREQFYLWQIMQGIGQPMVVMPLLMMATNTVKDPTQGPFASSLVNTPRAVAEAVGVWLTQLVGRWRGGLHSARLTDQLGQERFGVLQGVPRGPFTGPLTDRALPPVFLPNGHPASPGALAQLNELVAQQTRILTVSDLYLVFAGVAGLLLLVLLILPVRTLPPRLEFAQK